MTTIKVSSNEVKPAITSETSKKIKRVSLYIHKKMNNVRYRKSKNVSIDLCFQFSRLTSFFSPPPNVKSTSDKVKEEKPDVVPL